MTKHNLALIQDSAPSAIIERAALAAAVTTALMPVERRVTIPILAHLRLTACDVGLRIVGTDMDIESAVTVPGAVDSRFDVTLPAHSLSDLLKRAKTSDHVAIEALVDKAELDFEGLRVTLNALPASDFPELRFAEPAEGKDKAFPAPTWRYSLPAASLATAFAKVEHAISTEEVRYYLNGVYIHDDADHLCFAATDGHRLSRYILDLPDGAACAPGLIVPRKTIAILRKMLSAEIKAAGKAKVEAAAVEIEVTDSKLRFTIGRSVVTSKAVDGTYPDYERCIPAQNSKAIKADRKALASAVEQVTVVQSERGRAVKITMGAGRVTLECDNPDMGSARIEVPAVIYSTDPDTEGETLADSDLIDFGLNSSYLVAALGNIGSDHVEIRVEDAGAPVRFHDPDDERLAYVLMPMRV